MATRPEEEPLEEPAAEPPPVPSPCFEPGPREAPTCPEGEPTIRPQEWPPQPDD